MDLDDGTLKLSKGMPTPPSSPQAVLQLVLNVQQEHDASKYEAQELALHAAHYERDLLTHQLEVVATQRSELQAQLRAAAAAHQQLLTSLAAAQAEAAALRQQAATAAADLANSQATATAAQQQQQRMQHLLKMVQQAYGTEHEESSGSNIAMQTSAAPGLPQGSPAQGAPQLAQRGTTAASRAQAVRPISADPRAVSSMAGSQAASHSPQDEDMSDLMSGLFDVHDMGTPHLSPRTSRDLHVPESVNHLEGQLSQMPTRGSGVQDQGAHLNAVTVLQQHDNVSLPGTAQAPRSEGSSVSSTAGQIFLPTHPRVRGSARSPAPGSPGREAASTSAAQPPPEPPIPGLVSKIPIHGTQPPPPLPASLRSQLLQISTCSFLQGPAGCRVAHPGSPTYKPAPQYGASSILSPRASVMLPPSHVMGVPLSPSSSSSSSPPAPPATRMPTLADMPASSTRPTSSVGPLPQVTAFTATAPEAIHKAASDTKLAAHMAAAGPGSGSVPSSPEKPAVQTSRVRMVTLRHTLPETDMAFSPPLNLAHLPPGPALVRPIAPKAAAAMRSAGASPPFPVQRAHRTLTALPSTSFSPPVPGPMPPPGRTSPSERYGLLHADSLHKPLQHEAVAEETASHVTAVLPTRRTTTVLHPAVAARAGLPGTKHKPLHGSSQSLTALEPLDERGPTTACRHSATIGSYPTERSWHQPYLSPGTAFSSIAAAGISGLPPRSPRSPGTAARSPALQGDTPDGRSSLQSGNITPLSGSFSPGSPMCGGPMQPSRLTHHLSLMTPDALTSGDALANALATGRPGILGHSARLAENMMLLEALEEITHERRAEIDHCLDLVECIDSGSEVSGGLAAQPTVQIATGYAGLDTQAAGGASTISSASTSIQSPTEPQVIDTPQTPLTAAQMQSPAASGRALTQAPTDAASSPIESTSRTAVPSAAASSGTAQSSSMYADLAADAGCGLVTPPPSHAAVEPMTPHKQVELQLMNKEAFNVTPTVDRGPSTPQPAVLRALPEAPQKLDRPHLRDLAVLNVTPTVSHLAQQAGAARSEAHVAAGQLSAAAAAATAVKEQQQQQLQGELQLLGRAVPAEGDTGAEEAASVQEVGGSLSKPAGPTAAVTAASQQAKCKCLLTDILGTCDAADNQGTTDAQCREVRAAMTPAITQQQASTRLSATLHEMEVPSKTKGASEALVETAAADMHTPAARVALPGSGAPQKLQADRQQLIETVTPTVSTLPARMLPPHSCSHSHSHSFEFTPHLQLLPDQLDTDRTATGPVDQTGAEYATSQPSYLPSGSTMHSAEGVTPDVLLPGDNGLVMPKPSPNTTEKFAAVLGAESAVVISGIGIGASSPAVPQLEATPADSSSDKANAHITPDSSKTPRSSATPVASKVPGSGNTPLSGDSVMTTPYPYQASGGDSEHSWEGPAVTAMTAERRHLVFASPLEAATGSAFKQAAQRPLAEELVTVQPQASQHAESYGSSDVLGGIQALLMAMQQQMRDIQGQLQTSAASVEGLKTAQLQICQRMERLEQKQGGSSR